MPPVVRAQLDYYAVLEIEPTAGTIEVNAAFRRLAWRYHPDRNPAPGATLQFQDINEAHQVLSDPERRAEYDAQWHPDRREHRQPSRTPVRPHYRRGSHRRRRVRAVLMALGAFVLVSSAWAVIFTVMTSAHSSASIYNADAPSPFTADASQGCRISMEMFPVSYTDEHGRPATAWDTEVRNCWGGSARVSSIPNLVSQRMLR
jgi:hypothetical protein